MFYFIDLSKLWGLGILLYKGLYEKFLYMYLFWLPVKFCEWNCEFFFYRAVLKRKKKLNTSYSGELSHSKVFNCLSLFLYNLYVVQKSRVFYLFRNIFALFDNIKSLMGKLAICYLVAKYRKYLQMP